MSRWNWIAMIVTLLILIYLLYSLLQPKKFQ